MTWETEVIVGKDQDFPEAMVAVRMATGERVRYVPERTCKAAVRTDYYEGKLDEFTCSKCEWSGYVDDGFAEQTIPNFCPNCGRKAEHD